MLGSYRIRELPAWDGEFARIEHGTGQVRVVRLDDRAVEIEVTGTTEPVLVALGTGFYPRWRARHASGAAQPVYAIPSIPGGKLHVVGAWVAPGRTTFTVDGPLPSDGAGRLRSLLAGALALALIVVWGVARWRRRLLRRLARARAGARRHARLAIGLGVPVLAVSLLVRGCLDARGVTPSLELGTGVRATATVEARLADGAWQTCGYARVAGVHHCPGLLVAGDGMASLLNDAPPSWGFNTPAIVVTPEQAGVEVRIRLRARLAGTYWTAVSHGAASLEAEGEPPHAIIRSVLRFADRGERALELGAVLASSAPWSFTFIHADTLVPARGYLVPPPAEPPAAVRAVR